MIDFKLVVIAGLILAVVILLVRLAFGGSKDTQPAPMGLLDKLVFAVSVLSALALGVTGFYATVVTGELMNQYILMAHVSVGGLFIVALLALGLLWADACQFGETPAPDGTVSKCAGRKLFFWIFLTTGVVTALTMVLSMYPIFGTAGLMSMYYLHRWAGLILLMAIIGLAFRK